MRRRRRKGLTSMTALFEEAGRLCETRALLDQSLSLGPASEVDGEAGTMTALFEVLFVGVGKNFTKEVARIGRLLFRMKLGNL